MTAEKSWIVDVADNVCIVVVTVVHVCSERSVVVPARLPLASRQRDGLAIDLSFPDAGLVQYHTWRRSLESQVRALGTPPKTAEFTPRHSVDPNTLRVPLVRNASSHIQNSVWLAIQSAQGIDFTVPTAGILRQRPSPASPTWML